MSRTTIRDESGRSPSVEQARELVCLVDFEGKKLYEAYRLVFGRKVAKRSASQQAGLIYREYKEKYWDDWLESCKRHNLNYDRWAQKTDQLLEAKTPKDVVSTELVEPDPESKFQFKPFTYQNRRTEMFEDGGTQLGALKELRLALGIGPDEEGGNGTRVYGDVFVVSVNGNIRKRPQEGVEERDVSPGDSREADRVQGS